MKFRSAVDPWFYATLAAAAVLVACVLLPVASSGGPFDVAVLATLAALALGLPLWLLCATVYEVEGSLLRVRSGPFRWSIPLSDIVDVAPSRSWSSSPALSLDRLEIRRANGKRMLLSPRDRRGFLAAIGRADLAPSTAPPTAASSTSEPG